MNRFIVDEDPVIIAESLCDQHIVKMPFEEAQMLCTVLWHPAPEYAKENDLYKPVHQNILAHCGRCTVEVIMNMLIACIVLCYVSIITDITSGMVQENTVLLYLKVVSSYQS